MARTLVVSMLVMLMACSQTVFGTDHVVGGNSGWALGTDYSTWSSAQTFTVGDNLVFNYDSTHQVDEVDSGSYKSCSASNSIKNYNDGNSKVPLTKAGTVYFICPTQGHCSGGMKLQVNVVAATSTTPTTPTTTTTTPPSGGSPPSESGTPPPSAPSPKPSSSAVIVSSHFLGSLFVAAIIVFGFMA